MEVKVPSDLHPIGSMHVTLRGNFVLHKCFIGGGLDHCWDPNRGIVKRLIPDDSTLKIYIDIPTTFFLLIACAPDACTCTCTCTTNVVVFTGYYSFIEGNIMMTATMRLWSYRKYIMLLL